MANDEVVVTYRENALPALGFNLKEIKEALTSYDDFKNGLSYCSTFFTQRPLLEVSGVVNQAQYQRAVEGEMSLERLAFLADFQKIKENQDKITDFSHLAEVVNVAFEKRDKICEIVGVESNYHGASGVKALAGFCGLAPAALGISFILAAGSGVIEVIIGGVIGTAFPVATGILLGKGLRKEEAAIRQLKAMAPFYIEQVGRDIEALPRNIIYLEALCSHIQEAVQENVSFYPERKLHQDEQKTLVGYLETDIPRNYHRLSWIQSNMPSVQSACQEKLASLR